ncbi:hypothetical protein DPMN_132954 [Dreissena polymorpha]|uniref:Uncharacterized protein n=1 Tax=Dreissena polymorpha TaxID=45954 RepID=A0A9D4J9C2_DREPO|nr:hypothetical protein DPMN_132954 [Dreissena polymorpha]
MRAGWLAGWRNKLWEYCRPDLSCLLVVADEYELYTTLVCSKLWLIRVFAEFHNTNNFLGIMPRLVSANRRSNQMVDAESTPRTLDIIKLCRSRNLLVLRELYCTLLKKRMFCQ